MFYLFKTGYESQNGGFRLFSNTVDEVAHRPNVARCLFLKAQFYWNIDTLIPVLSLAEFALQRQSRIVPTETVWLAKPELLLSGPLEESVPPPVFQQMLTNVKMALKLDNGQGLEECQVHDRRILDVFQQNADDHGH